MKLLFKETQRFSQWWLWVILIGIGILPLIGIYQQLILDEPFGNKPMSNSGLVIFAVFVFGLIASFLMMQLKTEIDENEIRIRFFPLVKKSISWTEIKSAEVIDYGFVGGWGIRFGTSFGTVYNIKGKKGLAIELMNGKKLVIGTQKEAEMNRVIEELIRNKL